MDRPSWKDPSYYINQLFVEESCLELEYTKEIISRTRLPYKIVSDRAKPSDLDKEYIHNLTKGKQQLFLCKNRGQFLKPCPGTKEYQCCDYQVINSGTNCPIDCVYCILQAYLNTPWLTFHVNIQQMFDELEQAVAKSDSAFRIGTGEFTDSMALDRLTALSSKLVKWVSYQDNVVLELKTKSGVIENLQNLQHNNKVVVAWSLNSPKIVKSEEIRAATLKERLEAAATCAQWGYKLAFHFDPIIEYDGWQQGYYETIDRLYKTVPAEKIVWISLGAFRFIPSLKEIGSIRFPKSRIFYNEFIMGLDNKIRYFRPNRVELYRFIYNELKKRSATNTCIYFCMESDEIWKEVMGFCPEEKGGLPKMLDKTMFG